MDTRSPQGPPAQEAPAQHIPLLRGPRFIRLLMDRASGYFFRRPWPAIYHASSRVDYDDRALGE